MFGCLYVLTLLGLVLRNGYLNPRQRAWTAAPDPHADVIITQQPLWDTDVMVMARGNTWEIVQRGTEQAMQRWGRRTTTI